MDFLISLPWYVFALASAVLVGTKTVLQKLELKREHSLDYVVAFSVVTLVITLFLWPWVDLSNVGYLAVVYTYAAALFGSIGIWLGAKALRHLDVSFVSPQTILTTLFTLVFAYFILGEVLTQSQWSGVVILLFSALVLAKGSFASFHSFGLPGGLPVGGLFAKKTKLLYELLLILSMILFGLATVMDKLALANLDAVTFIFLIGVFLCINHLILYWVVVGNIKKIPRRVDHLGWIIVLIAVLTILSRLTYAQALNLTELSLVMPIKKISILIPTIWGGKILKEKHLPLRIVVAGLMLLGVWLLVK